MKVRKFLPTMLAVVLLLALAGVAYAFQAGNVDGRWGTIDTNGAQCDTWATGPAGGSTDYGNPTSYDTGSPNGQGTIGGTDWNQVRYGDPESALIGCPDGSNWRTEFSAQSGFGFDGVNDVNEGGDGTLTENEPFLLGKFCHFNNPIYTDNTFLYSDLSVQVDGLLCDNGSAPTPPTFTFTRRFTLDETSNNASPCPYGDTQPCGDQIVISGAEDEEVFTCQVQVAPPVSIDYTISTLGFIGELDGGCTTYDASKVKYTYFSDESATNCACLWAAITEYTPTAVELGSFTATVGRTGVKLDWTTTTEVDNVGFNVYRADAVGGPKTKLNAALIPTQVPPGSPIGASYTYLDQTVRLRNTYFYWVEDVDVTGKTGLHGPVEVSTSRAGLTKGVRGTKPGMLLDAPAGTVR